MPSLLRSASALVAGVALMCAGESIAAAKTNGSWRISITGDACTADRAAIEHEIALACSAVKTCARAEDASDVDLIVALDCSSAAGWTLDTQTTSGATLSHVVLSGDRDDRFRSIAIQVAHDAAQEEEEDEPAIASTAPASFVTITDESDRLEASREPPEKISLGLGARASAAEGGGLGGFRLSAAFHLGRGVRATTAFLGDVSGKDRAWRGGVGIAAGAPFDHTSIFGVAFEGGLGARQYYGQPVLDRISAKTDLTVYGQGLLVLQVPRAGLRPYFGLGSLVATTATDPTSVAFLSEIGLVLPVF